MVVTNLQQITNFALRRTLALSKSKTSYCVGLCNKDNPCSLLALTILKLIDLVLALKYFHFGEISVKFWNSRWKKNNSNEFLYRESINKR